MATITGLTAERMLEIEAQCIVNGAVDLSDHLILTKHDGTTVDAGNVRGPAGSTGATGTLAASTAASIDTAAGAGGARLDMRDQGAGTNLKRARIKNEAGKTVLDQPDDAYGTIRKVGAIFDHNTGTFEIPHYLATYGADERRPGWQQSRKKRWLRNNAADASHRRMSILWASRSNTDWASNEGIYITVRTGYYSGGSRTRCFLSGGYNSPFVLTPLEAVGPRPIMPIMTPDALVTGSIYQVEVYVQMPQYMGVIVEVEHSEDYAELAWGAAFTTFNQMQFNPDGRTTVLGADPGFWQSGAGALPGLMGTWQNVGIGGSSPPLLNGWVFYGGAEQNPRFRKDTRGVVTIEGLVKNGTAATTIFQLPVGYRPTNTRRFATLANGAISYLAIGTNGNIDQGPGASTAWQAFDGIQFATD